MDAQVGGERRAAGELDPPDLADRLATTYDRERALVEVAKRRGGPRLTAAGSPRRRDAPAGWRPSRGPATACRWGPAGWRHVADRRDLGMARAASGRAAPRCAQPIHARACGLRERLAEARCADARRPDHGSGWDPLGRPAEVDRRRRAGRSRWRGRPRARSRRARQGICAALADSFSLNAGTRRSPASSRITRALAGVDSRETAPCMLSARIASAPATSTPGGSAADDGERQPLVARLAVASLAPPARTRRRRGCAGRGRRRASSGRTRRAPIRRGRSRTCGRRRRRSGCRSRDARRRRG